MPYRCHVRHTCRFHAKRQRPGHFHRPLKREASRTRHLTQERAMASSGLLRAAGGATRSRHTLLLRQHPAVPATIAAPSRLVASSTACNAPSNVPNPARAGGGASAGGRAATDAAEARGAGAGGTSDADAQGEDNRHAAVGRGRWAALRCAGHESAARPAAAPRLAAGRRAHRVARSS
jgi:hypothetical protein